MTNKITKFMYFGAMAWMYSIVVQTPFAVFVWHMSLDPYITCAIVGIPITFTFFGWAIKKYLDWCGLLLTKINGDGI